MKGDRTRERIVAEAAELFNRHGYEGFSMSALMEATGLEKGGIYRHFASKEELALEAFDYARRMAQDARNEGLDSKSNSVDKLKLFIRHFVEPLPILPGGCPIFNTAVDSDDGNPKLRERARRALRQWRNLLTSIVRQGIEKDEIRKNVSPQTLAILIISSLEGALIMGRLEGNRQPLLAMKAFLDNHLESEVRSAC